MSRYKTKSKIRCTHPGCTKTISKRGMAMHLRGHEKEKLKNGGIAAPVFPAWVYLWSGKKSVGYEAKDAAEAISIIKRPGVGKGTWHVTIGKDINSGVKRTARQWLEKLHEITNDQYRGITWKKVDQQDEKKDDAISPPINPDAAQDNALSREERTNRIKTLIDRNGIHPSNYSTADLALLRTYEGHGGIFKNNPGKTIADAADIELGVMDQFYTPYDLCAKMWGLAYKHGFDPSRPNRILEPAAGIGRLLEYVPPNQTVIGYEIDKYAFTICKLSFPQHAFFNASFETMFFHGSIHLGMGAVGTDKLFDLVISNPPFRKYESPFYKVKGVHGSTEQEETLADTFDQYFLMRGIDVLVPGGLLVYIMPNTFMSNGGNYDEFKKLLYQKADLVDAYRLPTVFDHTQMGTDLLVLKKWK